MITSHAISCYLAEGLMKVRCCNCLNNEDYITNRSYFHYCNPKQIWIPERKYERRRKCGKFKPLPWPRKEVQPAMANTNKYEPQETKPTGPILLQTRKLRWREKLHSWEHWRGFFFLPGFLGRKLRQITNYASKVTIVH